MSDETYHIPVLLEECVKGLEIKPNGIYVDVTFGGGGHSKEIIKHLDTGKLLAFDQDEDAAKNVLDDQRFIFVNQNFRFLSNYTRMHGYPKVDGILADLGVSSHQFNEPERGFSIRFDDALDMRMNQRQDKSAKTVVNEYEEDTLKHIFKLYGELPKAHKIARAIVIAREEASINTTGELMNILRSFTPPHKENKFFAQIFQAIRIEVNQELDVLKKLLEQCNDILKPGGKLVVMSYHSLEDRLVKNFMRSGNFEGEVEKDFFGQHIKPFKIYKSKPIIPTEEEIEMNPRARSAKLRIAEKL